MTTTTTVGPAPAAPPAVSSRLALVTGVVVLIAAIAGIAIVNIVRPAQSTAADTMILTLAVPAVAGLFIAAKVSYAAGSLLANQATHTGVLTTIQTQLNGQLDARIKNAVREVLQELQGIFNPAPAPVTPPPAPPAPPAEPPAPLM